MTYNTNIITIIYNPILRLVETSELRHMMNSHLLIGCCLIPFSVLVTLCHSNNLLYRKHSLKYPGMADDISLPPLTEVNLDDNNRYPVQFSAMNAGILDWSSSQRQPTYLVIRIPYLIFAILPIRRNNK